MSKITEIVDDVIAKTNTNTTDIAAIEASKLDTAIIHSATSKTTLTDNDEFAVLDSANAFSLKKFTLANLKATLLSYLDTLFSRTNAIFGINQTYKDVTSANIIGASYSNTSGKFNYVCVVADTLATANQIVLSVDGKYVSGSSTNNVGRPISVYAFVPNGSSYIVTAQNISVVKWLEIK